MLRIHRIHCIVWKRLIAIAANLAIFVPLNIFFVYPTCGLAEISVSTFWSPGHKKIDLTLALYKCLCHCPKSLQLEAFPMILYYRKHTMFEVNYGSDNMECLFSLSDLHESII